MCRVNPPPARCAGFTKSALGMAIALAYGATVMANPVGPSVAAGSAQFATQGSTLTVTNSPGTVINWQQFNIAANETTRFVQQSAQSTVLNRIGGQNASQILGTLQSNGRVFLINPNGVLFGQGAIVDVAGLVASSLNLSDANFLAGKLSFGGGNGIVSNAGRISTPLGGSVYLVGHAVENSGVITSPQGRVLLAAGNSVSLVDSAGPELSVTITAAGNKAVNLGTVSTEGGRIDMFGALIEQAGVLRADSASVDAAGNIVLSATEKAAVSGTIAATNQTGAGGSVKVLGDEVHLAPSAIIDVSSKLGSGGAALIGGDRQGGNPAVRNAHLTKVAAGAMVNADAGERGDGGKIIVWADDKAVFDGYLSARGGARAGNGGFVETSGRHLDFSGRVDTRAPAGQWGTWLIDPDVVCMVGVGGCPVPGFGTGNVAPDTTITVAQLDAALSSSNVSLAATTLIAVMNSFSYTAGGAIPSGRSLSLSAPHVMYDGQINMTAAGSGTGVAHLSISAGGTPQTPTALSSMASVGKLVLGNNAVFRANNGSAKLSATSELQLNGPTSPGFQLNMGGGEVEMRAPLITTASGPSGAPTLNANYLGVWANMISGSVSPSATVVDVDIGPYSSTASLYLGLANADSRCQAGNLCLNTSNSSGVNPSGGLWLLSNNNLTVSSAYSFSGPTYVALTARNNLVLDAGLTMFTAGNATYPPLAMYAGGQFINNVGASAISMHLPNDRWGLLARNAESVSLNGLTATTTTVSLGGDPWNRLSWSNGAYLQNAGDFLDSGQMANLKSLLASSNGVAYFGTSTASDPCVINPVSCQPASGGTSGVVKQTQGTQVATQGGVGSAAGAVTYAPALNVGPVSAASPSSDNKGVTPAQPAPQVEVNKVSPPGAQSPGAATEASSREPANVRRPAQNDDERKTPGELKREAQGVRDDARKLEAEVKKSELDLRKAESEAKRVEAEARKSDAEVRRADAEVKRAEIAGQKAETEANKHAADARQAEREAGEAKTLVAKASAEAKKAEAESKKAEAESRQIEVQAKKTEAAAKRAEAESRKAEAEGKRIEIEAKKVEVEARRVESEAVKAEAEHKQALAEAKEAKTPQQKAAAERRAEEKRIEAVQKKAESVVKKEAAEAKAIEAEAKQLEADARKAEGDSKKIEADSKKIEIDAKRSEAQARKTEAEAKKAEADGGKARDEGKPAEVRKAEAKKAEAERQKQREESKAEEKKAEADRKHKEAESKLAAAEKKKAEAEQRRVEAERKQQQRREQAIKAFGRIAAAAQPDVLARIAALRHEHKTEVFKAALSVLEGNPKAADLPSCGVGTGEVCVPPREAIARQTATSAPRVPAVAFVPQIERKVAVIVAINNYGDKAIPPLEAAIPDGEAIGRLMAEHMGYEVRVIRDGTKAEIVQSLNALAGEVGANDSVQVYYAGHGYQLPDKSGKPGEGYWIPADGSAKSPANWLSNGDVSKLLANIPAKQVMLVSDSCYSGAFAKEQKFVAPTTSDPKQLLAKRTVVVMSSGGEEPVSDEGKDGHSIFAWSLMNTLKSVDKFDSGSRLFEGVRRQVSDEFPQLPQYGAAGSAGHVSGGDYLFEARRY